jgi:hypothetical protein
MNAINTAFLKAASPIRRGHESSWVNVEGGTVSGRVTKVIGVEAYFASLYDSAAQCRFRIGADAHDRHGFATAAEAQGALDAFLLDTARARGRA